MSTLKEADLKDVDQSRFAWVSAGQEKEYTVSSFQRPRLLLLSTIVVDLALNQRPLSTPPPWIPIKDRPAPLSGAEIQLMQSIRRL